MNNSIYTILKEANENFEKINSKGNKFKSRQIPIYIRKNLMKPWYITPGENGKYCLHIIQCPYNEMGKVFFVKYTLDEFPKDLY